jgi:hypothetical protein
MRSAMMFGRTLAGFGLMGWILLGTPASARTAATPPPAAPSDGWEFEATPYLWGAGLDGDVGIGRLPAQGVEASFSDIVSVLDIGLMGTFEGRKDRWGFVLDSFYLNLSESAPTPGASFGDAKVDLTQQFYSLGGTYRVTRGKVPVDLLVGVRYFDLALDLELTSGTAQGRQRGDSVTWWDGLAGARVQWAFARQWTLVGYGDVGGGGARLTWQAVAGVNWHFSKHLSGKFGYRYLSLDYDDDQLLYDVAMAGPYAGLGIRF